MKKVAVLVGSLRAESSNRKLANSLEALGEGRLEFTHVDLNLPLFNQDLEADVPESVIAARDVVREADVVLLITPEYNRSPSGVLKNAIDWLSRPYGQGVLQGRKVAIAGAGGALATGPAQAQLRSIIGYLNMPLMGQPELYLHLTHDTFDESGLLADSTHAKAYVDAIVDFAQK